MIELGRQFMNRIKAWQEELDRQLYTPVLEIPFEGFVTLEALTATEAEKGDFVPFPAGTGWGACWEYGWFRADITLPPECENRRVVLLSGLDGEQLFYVNGKAAGAVDHGHPYIPLTRIGHAGEKYHVLAESYAGHGPRLESTGLCPPERRAVPDAPATQCVTGSTVLAVWNEDAYQLKLDFLTLTDLLQTLPETSLRAMKIAEALDRLTHEADLELPAEERPGAWRKGRECLQEAMACRNGSTAPEMRLIGQSHIDVAWLWPREETFHKTCRTYSTQLTLMEEYPGYKWLLCEPILLDMLRSRDPALWERILEAFRRGQIYPEGAFYVECDTNIPGGESLIRQLVTGQSWFREHFGTESTVGWLPDCFGFSAVLPQLFRKLGIRYFATQKLLRADPECETFPYQNFIWEGLDGSEVEALSFMRDNGPVSPSTFYRRWDLERTQKTGISVMLHPFGYGDGGGGPTRDMVELSFRLKDLEGAARSHYTGLREYFEEVTRIPSENRWVGELYLPWHRGTWTSQRRNKALIRRAEEALHNAELFAALSFKTDHETENQIREAWKELMFHQFHDVAGGVGIHRVHEESAAELTKLVTDMQQLTDLLLKETASVRDDNSPSKECNSVLNPLAWPRTEAVRDSDGCWKWVHAPASGAFPADPVSPPDDVRVSESTDGFHLTNRYLSITVDRKGRIVSLTDRENDCSLLKKGQVMNDWRLYRNVQTVYDAWELDRDWPTRLIPDAVQAEVSLQAFSPDIAELKIARRFGHSSSIQVLRIYGSSRRVDFETEIDWQERHRMLKTHFESALHHENALHEIQFGHVSRPAHRSGPYASDRYEVCQQRWSAVCEANRGFALLNNGIFGISSERGELALTLLRGPAIPDEENNRGIHHMTYSLFPFAKPLEESGTVQAGYELNQPLRLIPGRPAKLEGPCLQSRTMILETVKRADYGEGIILRLYQSMNAVGAGILKLPFEAELFETAMDERKDLERIGTGRRFELTASPFEIRTIRAVILPSDPFRNTTDR